MRSWKLGHKSIQKCYIYINKEQPIVWHAACLMLIKKKLINKDGFSSTMIRANWL